MPRKHLRIFILTVLAILFFACSGSNKYAKKAEKFEENGFHKQAAAYYLVSLRRKNTNIDARIGLINNGQKVMDDHLREFFLAHSDEDYKKSVYSFLTARSYYKEVNSTGVELKIPDYYEGYYKNDLEAYLTSKYTEGTELLNSGEYEQSNVIFTEINRLDPDFKDTDRLVILSKAEPLYMKAEAAFENEQYRYAYSYYTSVIKLDKEYKDSFEKREYAHQKAMFTIAILNEDQHYSRETTQLNAYVLNKLVESNNPFITVIERTSVDRISGGQKKGMNGAFDQNSAVSAGNLIGVKAVLLGKIIELKKVEGRMSQNRTMAYKKVKYLEYDKVTKTNKSKVRYDKVYYTSYHQRNMAELTYQYQLISVETGQVLSTDIFSGSLNDQLNYATYEGDTKLLYPKPNATLPEKNKLDGLINGKKTIKSISQLTTTIYNSLSKQVSSNVVDYEKSRL